MQEPKPIKVSDRYIKKEMCLACNGIGNYTMVGKGKCPNCCGVGWIDDEDSEPQICLICEGTKEVDQDSLEDCETCDGRGYHVKIVRDETFVERCHKCEGGRIECDCLETDTSTLRCAFCNGSGKEANGPVEIECPDCQASGMSNRDAKKSFMIGEWAATELGKKVYRLFGNDCFSEMSNKDKIIIDDWNYVMVEVCPKCSGTNASNGCFLCNDRKVIKVIHTNTEVCSTCGGTKSIITDDCIYCGGLGKRGCRLCEGSLMRDCPDCNGSGIETHTITVEVG